MSTRSTRIASAGAVLAVLAGCAAPVPKSGDALPGVSLTASGKEVVFAWAPDSMVVRALRPGSQVEIVGDYPTSNGRVTGDSVAVARVVPGSTQLRFTLADSLKGAPTGPVCLRLRADGRAVPIRAAGGGSTDGFQYAAWATSVSGASKKSQLQRELASLTSAEASDAEALSTFNAWRQQRGITDAPSCDRLTAASASDARPNTAIEPNQRDAAAQRECIWRFKLYFVGRKASPNKVANDLTQMFSRPSKVASSAGELAQAQRQAEQAAALRRAFDAYAAATDPPYKPMLALIELPTTSSVDSEYAKSGLTASAGLGLLTAFESCVADANSQFKLSYDTWQREQDPRLQTSKVEVLRSECRSRFADATRRTERATQRTARRQQVAAELSAASLTTDSLPNSVSLLDKACSAS